MKSTSVVVVLGLLCNVACCLAGELFDAEAIEFSRKLDLRALSLLPVQYRGRVAILDSLARQQLGQIYGSESIDGAPPAFGYLELYFNAGAYLDRPVLYVREKAMRRAIAGKLTGEVLADFQRTHRLRPATLLDAEAKVLLRRTGRAEKADVQRTAAIASLREVLFELSKRAEFRLPLDRLSARYLSFLAAEANRPDSPGDWRFALADQLPNMLGRLQDAWRRRDSRQANELIGRLAGLREAGSMHLPSRTLRYVELLYNRTYSSTIVFVGFAAAMVLMVVAAASKRKLARRIGLGVFALSTAALAIGFVVRWMLSGRTWYLPPIMNQFEAVVGSALLGAVVAVALECVWKQSYFALAASFYATIALLSGLLFPRAMGVGITATHGILDSPVMAAHVAVIIVGHALAGMTLAISTAYLAAAAIRVFSGRRLASSTADLSSSTATDDPLAAIDRCNLIVAQLAAWTILVGTMLGAVWGDFAWGRWWGWDPKETWALLTALVYIAVLHLRFVAPRRWRGLLTAVGCIIGCAVMLFNWTVVNYLLAGKHSYA